MRAVHEAPTRAVASHGIRAVWLCDAETRDQSVQLRALCR